MITLDVLQQRRESLASLLTTSTVDHDMLKDRLKVIKKEIANINGAIIELERMIETTLRC